MTAALLRVTLHWRHTGARLLASAMAWLVSPVLRAQSAIPFKHEAAAGGVDGSRVMLALLLCVLVLGLVLFLLRRYLPAWLPGLLPTDRNRLQSGGRRLQILETQRLGPRTSLHVVQFGERQILIGNSEQGLVRLASAALPPATETESPDAKL